VSHDLERIRDFVEGRLPPQEREAFGREIARDPGLAELVETYELVVRATSEAAPAATTSFGDVMVRAGAAPRRRWPLVAAAAALLLAAGLWLLLPRDPAPLQLGAISLKVLPAPETPPHWPPELLKHRTADEEGLLFYDDMETALAVARVARAPVFLFIHYPGCSWCDDFRDVQCRDGDVIKAAESYVLLTLDWRKAPRELQESPNEGWPIFDVLDADGRKIDGFKGMRPAEALAAFLRKRAARPDWEGLGEGARKLDEAEAAADPARRLELYRQVAAADSALSEVARARIAEMGRGAQDALLAARDDALRLGAAAAADRLGAAVASLRGTPYGDDLERVLAFVRDHGSFPALKE
jgi:hypothetical protein